MDIRVHKRKLEKKASNLANGITLFRFFVLPIIMLLLLSDSPWTGFMAGVLVTVAGLSDYLDGFVARYYNAVSDLGKFLDPLADKLLVATALIMLSSLMRVHPIIVVIVIGREIFITGLRAIISHEGVVMAASDAAKWKTVFQMIAIVGLCVNETYFGLNFHITGLLILYVSLGFSLYSAYGYVESFFKNVHYLK
ncbi:MAG: CDP-diacylglycerol--glycerol-3-phosphate 3-phosphatidyltransferase [Deltaproteobacteria bacterium]|nr:CDP-diacylglycerol--glycerol-3-phosphate 3-phosphatidyltransferase [Deltaproteobacteria bacterium]